MPRQRTPNLYVFFKTRVSHRRARALFAEHNLVPIVWLPHLNGHGLVVPPTLLPAVRRLLGGHPLVAALMTKESSGFLRALHKRLDRRPHIRR